MNARERVLAVLNRETPDRVPVDLWLAPELVEKFKRRLEVGDELDIYRELDVDKIAWLGIPYKGRMIKDPNEQVDVNHWGVKFRKVNANEKTEYSEVSFRPLEAMEDPSALEDYPWPDPGDFDYEAAAREARQLASEFVTLGPWVSLFEVYCMMRSLEQALMDTVAEPEFLHAALDKIAWSQGEMLRRFLDAAGDATDMVFISDDVGMQQNLLISPQAFDEFLFPRLKNWCDMIHDHGARVFFHTDGAAEPLIPRLIEAGVDVLNPIQHVCPGMDRESLKAQYGDRLIFHGGVENQQTLPFGTPEEVARETHECLEKLGPDGYIPCSCHFAQADTPEENILALVRTVREFRV
ncbi:uroporphyrinogen decarboxylase family protein [Kiritimatiella glycovorans]|uniref:Methylcobalamin:coenzyme M methyltransferase n=1 Tax=Kiritimatiella glycovorans TaxID=1307763 RepID=A0A0G3EBE1_9BACT|nr:uroporphyrinogen decarboxylase family protein [Kiritimatiella glycovorans]AKJ63613.1 methylcobalamin:coenzyme M methyltransferase [Kiritimatiella glycovorans]